MEETDSSPQLLPQLAESEEEQRLKYLEFVQATAILAVMYATKLYGYAKENSGPLKRGVDTVEGAVKTVVAPVFNKYQGTPVDVLKFVDRKVDESVTKVQSRVPTALKEAITQVLDTAQKAPAAARSVLSEVKNTGVVGSASGLAKTLYDSSECAATNIVQNMAPTALKEVTTQALEAVQKAPAAALSVLSEVKNTGVRGTVSGIAKMLYDKSGSAVKNLYAKFGPLAQLFAMCTLSHLNRLPLFPQVAQAIGPAASYFTETYNRTIQEAAERGYGIASRLPLVKSLVHKDLKAL